MDEYNYQEYQSFHIEPEIPQEPQPEPPAAPKKKNKKSGSGAGKLIAVALICALLGGAGGGALVGAMMRQDTPSQTQQSIPNETQQKTDKTPETGFANVASTGGAMTPAQVYQKNVQAVVGITNSGTTTNIFGQTTATASSGSGFVISEDGYIVTNYHVIAAATSLTVSLNDGTEYPAQVVGYEEANDVALLKIEATGLNYVSFGDSDQLAVGDQVLAIGNPLGELTYTMTVGYVSALDRAINADGSPINMLQTDAAINPGNSGGPLFNMEGNVIGITTAKYSGSTNSGATVEGIGFAIPANDVLKIVNDLKEYGYVTGRAYLGITPGQNIDSTIAQMYQLPAGVYVSSVTEGSCSEAAGLKSGDIITALGDRTVGSYEDLVAALADHSAGDETTITVYRSGQSLELNVTLDERPRSDETQQETEQQVQTDTEAQQINPFDNPFGYFFGN